MSRWIRPLAIPTMEVGGKSKQQQQQQQQQQQEEEEEEESGQGNDQPKEGGKYLYNPCLRHQPGS